MKFSKYNMIIEMDYGLLLYNSWQTKCIQIYEEPELSEVKKLFETKNFDIKNKVVKTLYKYGFIVDDNIDEYEEVKKEIEKVAAESAKHLRILLYVTENCNFRCVYCPEKHVNKNFSDENWDALYKYIEKSLKLKKYKYITMRFFGGEPLLRLNQIIKFLDRLAILKKKYSKVIFAHHITTNGYLLTPKAYDKLVKRDVLDYQITIDGFAETHDKTRPLAGGGKSWNKIIENMKYINSKKDNANITFRTNISTVNIDTIDQFLKWATQEFDNKKIQFSLSGVTGFSSNVDMQYATDWREEKMEKIHKSVINSSRIVDSESSPLLKRSGACKCATNGTYTITVDGKIVSICEDAFEKDYYYDGVLTKDGDFEFKNTREEREEGYETPYCKDCIRYPLCAARACPYKKTVYPDIRPDCPYYGHSLYSVADQENVIIEFLKNKYAKVDLNEPDEKEARKKIAELRKKMKEKEAKRKQAAERRKQKLKEKKAKAAKK